jgi:hypothetical protein
MTKPEHVSWAIFRAVRTGLFWSAVLGVFGWALLVWIYDDMRLSRDSRSATATIIEVTEDYAESDSGQGGPFFNITYSFRTISGEEFSGADIMPWEANPQVGDRIDIEYLASNGDINRLPLEHKSLGLSLALFATVAGGLAYFLFKLWRSVAVELREISAQRALG